MATVVVATTAPTSGTVRVPLYGPRSAFLQASIAGTGAVTATVDIYGSIGGVVFAKLFSIALSGTGSDSSLPPCNIAGLYVKATVSAVSGTSATVTVEVS